jgi:hypothetical protein
MVNKVSELIEDKFIREVDWNAQYFNESELKETELKSFIDDLLIELINYFSESILIGEYELKSDIEDILIDIGKKIASIYDTLAGKQIENAVLFQSVKEFINALNLVISGYINFCKLISIHKTFPNYDLLFSSSPNNSALLDELDLDENIIGEIFNFFNTLELYRHDHFLDERIEYFKALLELEESINSSRFAFKHVSALNIKISFLKLKWVNRQNTTAQTIKQEMSIKCFLIDNKLISVHDIPDLNSPSSKLNDWKTYLEYHYNSNNLTDFYIKRYQKLKLADLTKLDFYDLHFLIKYHKDINSDYINLSKIVLEIESREDDYKSDKELYFKNLNYALNNQFSLLVENINADDAKIISLKDKITSLQKESSNDNFFVEFKYLQYCIKKLKSLVESREPLDDSNVSIHKSLKDIRLLFTECERKINWSQNHYNLLYQLPYEESLVEYNSPTELDKIYFASSFLLPLSIEQINYDFQKAKIDFNNEFNHFEVFSSLTKEFKIIKDLKDEVKNSDKKSIETITIFTAIISFIVGSVSGYKFIDSFPAAIIFLLIFSTSLFSFVLLIFISTKGFEVLRIHKKYILSVYIAITLLTFVIFYFKPNNEQDGYLLKYNALKKETNKKIDSTTKNYERKLQKLEIELKDLRNKHEVMPNGKIQSVK